MNFDEVPATLLGLVQRYSPSNQEAGATAWLVDRMHLLGAAQTYIDAAGNAVGLWGSGPRQIILLGHIDTVPGEIALRVEDGRFYGRGTVDAKGPLAAFVDAAAAWGGLPGWQVVVIGAVGEEDDSRGAQYLVGQYNPDYALIGEPSRWDRVTLGYKGSAWAEITVAQPLSHTARMDASACETAFQLWGMISAWVKAYNADREAVFDTLQVGLRSFSCGNDGMVESAHLQVGARLPLDLTPEAWYRQLNELISPAEVRPVGYAIPAYRGAKNSPLVRAFLGAVRAEGGQPGFVVKTGTADLNIVAPVWDCPAAAYGPGDSGLDHTPDEHIDLDEYARSVRVLKAMLQMLTRPQNS